MLTQSILNNMIINMTQMFFLILKFVYSNYDMYIKYILSSGLNDLKISFKCNYIE